MNTKRHHFTRKQLGFSQIARNWLPYLAFYPLNDLAMATVNISFWNRCFDACERRRKAVKLRWRSKKLYAVLRLPHSNMPF
jgi:hypothetical protein